MQPLNQGVGQGLTAERLQYFIAGLSGLTSDEVRKAKILFLRNELSQLKALNTAVSGFGVVQGCFAIIPIFWPILWAQRRSMTAALTLQKEQIGNALSVWREDLGQEATQIQNELDAM